MWSCFSGIFILFHGYFYWKKWFCSVFHYILTSFDILIAVDIERHMWSADGDGDFVPLAVGEHVGEDLRVCLLAFGLEMKTHFALLSAALQLQQPVEIQSM